MHTVRWSETLMVKSFVGLVYHTMHVFPYKPFLQTFSDKHIPIAITLQLLL